MKNLFFLSLLLGIVTFNSCKSDSVNPATSITEDNLNSVPSNERILNASGYRGIEIVGKFKVSDNEYVIYYNDDGIISPMSSRIILLDNGVWLFNDLMTKRNNRIIE